MANVGPPVLYLPPGVIVPAAPVPPPNSPPFDRGFFERVLPEAVRAFCEQAKCEEPVVELLTVDGERHYVRGISGVADQWVALHTVSPDHPHPVQVFVPYATVYRVEIHPERDERRGIGFVQPRSDQE